MAAKSTDNGDIQEWIQDTINSCTTIEQCISSYKLIDLFNIRLHKTTKMDFIVMLGYLDLKSRLNKKIIEIQNNGKEISN